MSWLDPRVYKINDSYTLALENQDLNEISDLTLDELCEWAENLRKEYGGSARFETDHSSDGGSYVTASYAVRRPATEEEIAKFEADRQAKQEKEKAAELAKKKLLFEQLKAQFEPDATAKP